MTEAEVREMMRQAGLEGLFGWVCAYLAAVATARQNSLIPGGIDAAKRFVLLVIDGIKSEVERNEIPGKQYIQEKILNSLSRGGDSETNKVKRLDQIAAFPDVTILTADSQASMRLVFLQTKYATELGRLTHIRNPEKATRGNALATKAEEFAGWFEWVDSRFDASRGMPVDQISKDGVIIYRNDFIKWVKNGHVVSPMTSTSKMNCWEAVFVAACYAGLIGVERLRNIHGFGTGAQAAVSEAAHDRRVQQALGLSDAFGIVKEIGLVPSRGDLIFAQQGHHVMICLGTKLDQSGLEILVMSLWSSPKKQFCKTTTGAFQHIFEMKFVPCPF